MALLHSMVAMPATFGELSEVLLLLLVKLGQQWKVNRADLVTDQYFDMSIKNTESNHRSSIGTQPVHIFDAVHRVQTPVQTRTDCAMKCKPVHMRS